ncbi:MAG: hypothetical protein M1818_006393 [Claussenomyces sp. TS43310]|nr:MAG: hypothetical protein M1818_006393 [Claussenomyces sp. TS43310]
MDDDQIETNQVTEQEWERKERNREYRVAARREKRLRKADEKKQRKLNATLLRRMTKNPEKYTKNVSRNRQREIQLERRKIYREAIAQAERLAAVHDPSGKMFNVGPVVVQDDDKVVSAALPERRARAQAEKAAKLTQGSELGDRGPTGPKADITKNGAGTEDQGHTQDGINPARRQLIQVDNERTSNAKHLSKTQQKKLAMLEDSTPPPKPVIPKDFSLPEGEEDWISLWNLPNDDIERRILLEKKRKAAERKALRLKQKDGKAERRAARDERRKVYREKKLEWKAIKEAELNQRKALLRVEQEEAKKIEIEVNLTQRRRAMEACAKLGFTLENVEGVAEIKPRALGMKGQEIDFDSLKMGERPSMLKHKDGQLLKPDAQKAANNRRVDLGRVVDEAEMKHFISDDAEGPTGLDGDFVALNADGATMDPQQFGEVNYSHKLRRKLHRAIEAAQVKKELMVRAKAIEHCQVNGIEIPIDLQTEYNPVKLHGRRILENGHEETEKQERVRKRLELAEYNKAAKVLRRQAKAAAVEAGLRKFAELTGQVPVVEDSTPAIARIDPDSRSHLDGEEDKHASSAETKKRRRSGDDQDTKRSKRAKPSEAPIIEDSRSHDNGEPEAQPPKNAQVAGIPTEPEPGAKTVKSKEKKRSRSDHAVLDSSDVTSSDARKERKARHKKSKSTEQATNEVVEPAPKLKLKSGSVDQPHVKKSKKGKTKLDKTEAEPELDDAKIGTKHGNTLMTGSGNQWNSDALDGDTARKNKFLRLLGAGKIDSKEPAEGTAKSHKDYSGMKQVELDLVKQFDAGVRMKHDGQSKRRGLGA